MIEAPSPAERAALFEAFARALFTADMTALYRVVSPEFVWSYHDGTTVTKVLSSPRLIEDHLEEQKVLFSRQHFYEVVYHHLPDISFMTFRLTLTVAASGEVREQRGIERYSFLAGRIATKDVYRKPAQPSDTLGAAKVLHDL